MGWGGGCGGAGENTVAVLDGRGPGESVDHDRVAVEPLKVAGVDDRAHCALDEHGRDAPEPPVASGRHGVRVKVADRRVAHPDAEQTDVAHGRLLRANDRKECLVQRHLHVANGRPLGRVVVETVRGRVKEEFVVSVQFLEDVLHLPAQLRIIGKRSEQFPARIARLTKKESAMRPVPAGVPELP